MSKSSKRITLKDIAREANLSVAAVSMGLKNNPDIAKKTAKRVQLLAEEMGYVPDPVLSALCSYRDQRNLQNNFSVIGLVTSWSTKSGWSELASSKEVIRGVHERASQLGYKVQEFWAREPGVSPSRFSDILSARGIQGLILAPFENNDEVLDLDWERFSVVTISRPSRYARMYHVVQNHYMDMLNCWEETWRLGYRKIGLVVQDEIASRWSHQWEAAYRLSCQRAGVSNIPVLQVKKSQEIERIREWLKAYKPDAVIGRCDSFLAAAEAEGVQVPNDVGYASLNVNDDIETAAGVRHRRDVIGATSVDVLNSFMQRNFKGPQEVSSGTQIDGIWQGGLTLPAVVAQQASV